MGRARPSLVQKLLRAADAAQFELPKGWHVLSRYRTAELFLKHPSPPSVQYNDKNLYKQLLEKYPEVKLQPLRVNSTQASLATRFVTQQQQVMQQLDVDQRHKQQGQQQQRQQPQAQLPLQDGGLQHSGMSRADLQNVAFRQVEAQLSKELQDAGRETSAGGYLEHIQEQEEEALQTALKKLKDQEAALQKS